MTADSSRATPPEGPTASPALRARSVSKSFPGGVHALREADLEAAGGETVALIGESGSGKTTLLRMFNRLVEPTGGELFFDGRPLTAFDPIDLRRRFGYVQQEGGLIPHWTVARNVGLVPQLLRWNTARISQRVETVLDAVELPAAEYADRYPKSLSGGQRQRVAIARALAADPEVILLDEPFGALDPITRSGLQDEFLRLKAQLGKTMLLVTHDLPEAFHLADRIAVLYQGRIEQFGTPRELREKPKSKYVERLLSRQLSGAGGGG